MYEGLRSSCMNLQWWKTLGQHALKFASQTQSGLFLPLFLLPTYLALHDLFIKNIMFHSVYTQRVLKKGKAAPPCCVCSLLLGQMHVSRKAVWAKCQTIKFYSRKSNATVHIEINANSFLGKSLQGKCSWEVPSRCPGSQEQAVLFMSSRYLLIILGWDKQRFLVYWAREEYLFQNFQCS